MVTGTSRSITVNQIGYPTESTKLGIFSQAGPFQVINETTSEVIFRGVANGSGALDEVSGKTVFCGDFSKVNVPGKYVLVQEDNKSATFEIGEQPYNDVLQGLVKAFYYLRCGMELTEEYAGPWKHAACHTTKGIVYGETDRHLDCSGGWHDAGDYGKYTVAAAKALADLFLAHELNPSAFAKPIPIPETDGIIPDILHECRYELDWLFKMQDDGSGGVFHKLTTLYFPGLAVMPEDDHADLYFSPISTTATASFTAIMAMAARVFESYDVGYAQKCLDASLRAWRWLSENPEFKPFKNPPEISTGEYGDPRGIDEIYWAAAELYRTTGEETYHNAFKSYARDDSFSKTPLGWVEMGGYGTITYLLTESDKTDSQIVTYLESLLIEEANSYIEIGEQDGYKISLKKENYVWGSNMVVMNNAMLLLVASKITGEEKYSESALEHVHYLLGRNVLDISYVTGFGDRPVMNPHHRPSVADSVIDPVPGFVAGGPDKNLSDPLAKEELSGKAPAQCFIDHQDSYSTNEITIYWNSPAVFVFSFFA